MATRYEVYVPHDVNIIQESSTIYRAELRKHTVKDDNYVISKTIPASGVKLDAQFDTIQTNTIDGVPHYEKICLSVDPIPKTEADIIIVSAIYYAGYMSRYGESYRLRTIIGPVFTQDGRTILGCLGLGTVKF